MIDPIVVLPAVTGFALLASATYSFRRDRIAPRYFGYALLFSALLLVSPLIYWGLTFVTGVLGFTYTFVLGFGLAFIFIIAVLTYLMLLLGKLRHQIVEMQQEIALLREQQDE